MRFVFGYDALANLIAQAQDLPGSCYRQLSAKAEPEIATRPRTGEFAGESGSYMCSLPPISYRAPDRRSRTFHGRKRRAELALAEFVRGATRGKLTTDASTVEAYLPPLVRPDVRSDSRRQRCGAPGSTGPAANGWAKGFIRPLKVHRKVAQQRTQEAIVVLDPMGGVSPSTDRCDPRPSR